MTSDRDRQDGSGIEGGIGSRRSFAMAIFLVTLVLCVAAAALIVASAGVAVPDSWGFRGAPVLFGITSGSVGAIVLRRRPDSTIGWMLAGIGLCFAFEALVDSYTVVSVLQLPGRLPGQPWIGWLLTWLWIPPVVLSYVYLPLLFPSGDVPSPRWRPVAWLGAIGCVTFGVAIAIMPGPIAQAAYLENPLHPAGLDPASMSVVVTLGVLPLALAMVLAVVSLIRRFQTADDVTRRQIKWFALATIIAGGMFGFYLTTFLIAGHTELVKISEILVVLSLTAIPVAIGIAILRYRLYEIDRLISRTLGWATVSVLLVIVFVVGMVGLQAVLSGVTQGQTLAVAASTLAAFALFQPLRRRVQLTVDRRFDRARYDAELTATAFADRLRDEVDIATVTGDLRSTTDTALAPSSVAIWLRRS